MFSLRELLEKKESIMWLLICYPQSPSPILPSLFTLITFHHGSFVGVNSVDINKKHQKLIMTGFVEL